MIGSSGDREAWVDTESVRAHGFLILPHVLICREIEALLCGLADMNHHRGRAGIRHLLHHRAVAEVAADPRLLGIARAVLRHNALPFRTTLFDKSPDSNWLITWHQDTALPLTEKRETPGWGPWSVKEGVIYANAPARALAQVLALRLHLDDCTRDNGPLRVLPGTHVLGVLSDEQILDRVARTSSVECLVQQGGVLAMRPLIVHASSKSQTQSSRRVLQIEYAACAEIEEGMHLAIA